MGSIHSIGHFDRLSDRVKKGLVNWLAVGLIPDGADAGAVGTDVVGFQGFGIDDTYSVQLVGGVAGLAAEGDLAGPADDGGGGLGFDSLDLHLAGPVHLNVEVLGFGTVQIDLSGAGCHDLNRVLG